MFKFCTFSGEESEITLEFGDNCSRINDYHFKEGLAMKLKDIKTLNLEFSST